MFENYDDPVDLDDEFLNIVFETEERDNNNKALRSDKPSAISSSKDINNPLVLREFRKNADDQSGDNINSILASSSSSTKNHFPQFNHMKNNILQPVNNNAIDKRKSSPPPSRSKRERKFPGPAGLLPDRKSFRGTPLKLDSLLEVESPSLSTPDELCSQGRLSGSVLEEGPWQNLMADMGPDAHMLDVINVASVKRKAAARCFSNRKVPFLAAMIHHLDVSSADPCIILRDSTGEIHGTVHRDVWQQFAAELVVGSVLVVRNVSLLSTGISSRRHYLNITANNLVTIYSASPDKAPKREIWTLTSQDYMRTIEHWQSLKTTPQVMESPSSLLFGNTSHPSPCCSSPYQSPHMNSNQPRFDGVGIPQHMKPSTSQNNQGCGSSVRTPPYPEVLPPSRPMGKKLFPSRTNLNNPKPVCALNSDINFNSSGAIRPTGRIMNQNNSGLSRTTVNNSLLPHSATKPNTSNIPNTKTSVPNNFKFNPKMLTNKLSTRVVSPQNNFEKRPTSTDKYGKSCEISLEGNSPRIILSQSSQLTVEEQSVVDSVFDGIDADSLFDDDF